MHKNDNIVDVTTRYDGHNIANTIDNVGNEESVVDKDIIVETPTIVTHEPTIMDIDRDIVPLSSLIVNEEAFHKCKTMVLIPMN